MTVVLRLISPVAGAALQAGRPPEDIHVAADHPTEFSAAAGGRVP